MRDLITIENILLTVLLAVVITTLCLGLMMDREVRKQIEEHELFMETTINLINENDKS